MIISENDSLWAADQFINYFKRFDTIELEVRGDYYRDRFY